MEGIPHRALSETVQELQVVSILKYICKDLEDVALPDRVKGQTSK